MCRFPAILLALALAQPAMAVDIPVGERRSGFDTMGPEARAMQRDDFANPAMLTVREGEMLWSAVHVEGKPSCRSCHAAPESMKGVAPRYPAFNDKTSAPLDLAGRIQLCQSQQQGIAAAGRESRTLLALEALVAFQSRGMPIRPPDDPRLLASRELGKALFERRMGQLDLSCAQCHTANWGKSLAGTRIPQAHPTGYPIFRLEWQATGSLQRRFRNCMTGVRAEPFAYGSSEFIALELFLRQRAEGMPMDAPGVRP